MGLEERGVRSPFDRPLEQAERVQRITTLRLVDGSQVEGTVHTPAELRILDHLNRQTEAFMAVTDAIISVDGQRRRIPFIAINKSHIVTLFEAPLA